MREPCPECGFTPSHQSATRYQFQFSERINSRLTRLFYEALNQHKEDEDDE